MTILRICWGIDAIVLLMAIFFFFDTLATATSPGGTFFSAWFFMLVIPALCLVGSYQLYSHAQKTWATLLAALPLVPIRLYALFVLIMVFGGGRWN